MLASFLLSLREGFEAALVIAIVLGALRRAGRRDCFRLVWLGTLSAVGLSMGVAVLLRSLGWSLTGFTESVFEGTLLLAAAALLTWMIFWASRQSRQRGEELNEDIGKAVRSSGGRGVFFLTFIAVFREGVELALFLTAAAFDTSDSSTIAGTLLGLLGAGVLGGLVFSSTAPLSPRRFFQATAGVLALVAAGLLAKGVHEFSEAGWIPAGADPVWNTRAWLNEDSSVGSLFGSLFGYTSTPTLSMVVAYAAYLGIITWWFRFAVTARNADARASCDLA